MSCNLHYQYTDYQHWMCDYEKIINNKHPDYNKCDTRNAAVWWETEDGTKWRSKSDMIQTIREEKINEILDGK